MGHFERVSSTLLSPLDLGIVHLSWSFPASAPAAKAVQHRSIAVSRLVRALCVPRQHRCAGCRRDAKRRLNRSRGAWERGMELPAGP